MYLSAALYYYSVITIFSSLPPLPETDSNSSLLLYVYAIDTFLLSGASSKEVLIELPALSSSISYNCRCIADTVVIMFGVLSTID